MQSPRLALCCAVAAAVVACVLGGAPLRPGEGAARNSSDHGSDTSVAMHYHFLLDRSGSMSGLADDVVGGFNGYVSAQQRGAAPDDDVRLSLVQFDTQDPHEVTIDGSPIADVAPLTPKDFVPRGGTPLYDAIGLVVARASSVAAARAEQGKDAARTVVIIFTDGEENSSKEHTKTSVAELIREKEKEGWAFVFLGANQDAYAEGGAIGIQRSGTQNFVADSAGMSKMFASLGGAMQGYQERVRLAKKTRATMMSAPAPPSAAEMERVEDEILADARASLFDGHDDAQRDYEQRTAR